MHLLNKISLHFFKGYMLCGLKCADYLRSSIPEDQVFDARLHSDVGSDQQLQSTDCWKLLRDADKSNNENLAFHLNVSLRSPAAGDSVVLADRSFHSLSDCPNIKA